MFPKVDFSCFFSASPGNPATRHILLPLAKTPGRRDQRLSLSISERYRQSGVNKIAQTLKRRQVDSNHCSLFGSLAIYHTATLAHSSSLSPSLTFSQAHLDSSPQEVFDELILNADATPTWNPTVLECKVLCMA